MGSNRIIYAVAFIFSSFGKNIYRISLRGVPEEPWEIENIGGMEDKD